MTTGALWERTTLGEMQPVSGVLEDQLVVVGAGVVVVVVVNRRCEMADPLKPR